MKKIFLVFCLWFSVAFSQSQPEIYVELENPSPTEVFTVRMHAMSFVYDRFYNYTENYQDAEEILPETGEGKFGFEFVTDHSGMGDWEMVAFAKYRVDIFSNLSEIPEIPLITFFMDFRTCTEIFYDIDIIIKRITDNEYEFYCRRSNTSSGGLLIPSQIILYWELAEFVYSNSCFYSNNYVRNKINSTNPYYYGKIDVNGTPFYQNDVFNVLKGYTHSFSTYSDPILSNEYKFRKWEIGSNEYSSTRDYRIIDGSDIIADFFKVLPLTITSYFEGAQNIGNYNLTWATGTNTSVTNSYSTTPYRAFKYALPNFDEYDIYANSFPGSYDNTTWQFSHWDDLTFSQNKSGIKVEDPGVNLTAYYKGRMRTNNASAFSPSSKNLIKYGSRYILIYESMDKIWYANSLNSFNGEWEEETDLLLINNLPGKAKNLYVDVYDGIVRVVFEYFPPQSSEAQIICAELEGPFEVIDTYPASFFGSAHPILSYSGTGNGYEELFIYKKSQSSGYYYKRYHYNGGQWYWASNQISTTSSASNNLTAVPDKNSTDNSIHLSWEENGDITYSLSYAAGGYRYFPASVISKNSGYPNNYKPSISLTGDGDVVVSWTADTEAFLSKLSDETETVYKTIVRAKHKDVWGSFFITGDNVDNTYNSSSLSTANETVIAWNENNNSSTKYTRRFNGNYCDVQTLNQSGSAPVLSNGAALSDIKAAVLNNAALPYKILKATNDFGSLCDFGGERTEKISSGIGMLY